LAAETDARLRLAHAGGGLIQGGAGLIEAELRVAVIELADDLALFDEIANVDGRGDHAPGNQRRDVAGFVGDKCAGLLEGGRNGAGDRLRGGDGYLLGVYGTCGRGLVVAGAAGQKESHKDECDDDKSVHLIYAPLGALVSWIPCMTISTKPSVIWLSGVLVRKPNIWVMVAYCAAMP